MEHPAIGGIMRLGRFAARFSTLPYHIEERLVAFGQIAKFRRPIIHFGIDVDDPFTVPGRLDFIVPETLQIRGLRTRPGTRDEEITPKVEIERSQVWIRVFCHFFKAFVGRKACRLGSTEVKLDAAKELLVISDMGFQASVE